MNSKTGIWWIALLLALFLWVQSALISEQKALVEIAVEFYPQPQELILAGGNHPTVELALEAQGIYILLFKYQNIKYLVDGSQLKYGTNKLSLSKDNLTCSSKQAEYVSGFKEEIKLIEMDRIISRAKPVILTFDSPGDEAFYLEQKLDVSSNIVQVRGPEKLLEKLENIKTEPVTKRELKNNQLKVALRSPSPFIKIKSEEIVILFNSQVQTIKTIPLIPILYKGSRALRFSPEKVTVKIEGSESQVSNMGKSDIRVSLEVNEQRAGYGKLNFELPKGLKLLEYTPEKVRYWEIETK